MIEPCTVGVGRSFWLSKRDVGLSSLRGTDPQTGGFAFGFHLKPPAKKGSTNSKKVQPHKWVRLKLVPLPGPNVSSAQRGRSSLGPAIYKSTSMWAQKCFSDDHGVSKHHPNRASLSITLTGDSLDVGQNGDSKNHQTGKYGGWSKDLYMR